MSKELIEIHVHPEDNDNKIYYCDKGNLFNTLYVINKEYPNCNVIKDILTADYNVQNDNCIMVLNDNDNCIMVLNDVEDD